MFSFDQFIKETKSETEKAIETIWAKLWIVSKDLRRWTLQIIFPNISKNLQFSVKSNKTSLNSWYNTAEEPISFHESFGRCLYRLSRFDHYHIISEITGHGLATVECITLEVCKVTVCNFWSKFDNFNIEQTAISQMADKWQFPSASGRMYRCHIPMKCRRAEMKRKRSIFKIFQSFNGCC